MLEITVKWKNIYKRRARLNCVGKNTFAGKMTTNQSGQNISWTLTGIAGSYGSPSMNK